MRCPELALLLTLMVLGCDGAEPPAVVDPPPDDGDLAAVQAWLFDGAYLEWERHDPVPAPGMSGGARVYLSPELAASLRSGASTHPLGAAAVRELVDAQDPTHMVGWAYMHKLDDAPDGQGWFFYEVFSLERDAAPQQAERGAAACVGCHQDGVDFVQSVLD